MAKADQELQQVGGGYCAVAVQIGGTSRRDVAVEGAGIVVDGGHRVVVRGNHVRASRHGALAGTALAEAFRRQLQGDPSHGDRAVGEAVNR